MNPTHVHDQDWLDQPFVLTRMFGPDGLRGPGVRAAWRTDGEAPFEVLAGVQNARGETAASFLSSDELFDEMPIGGLELTERDTDSADDLLYHARVSKTFRSGEDAYIVGASGLYGPNASGPDGETWIAGMHAGAQVAVGDGDTLRLQAEGLYRRYVTDDGNGAMGFTGQNLEDYGFYAQALYDVDSTWTTGLRFEYATGEGASVGDFTGRHEDPFRADRLRVSPILAWNFAPTARVALQYNYDDSDFLEDGEAHTGWIGVDWAIGAGRRAELNSTALHSHDHD
jgi:hypothetical protein